MYFYTFDQYNDKAVKRLTTFLLLMCLCLSARAQNVSLDTLFYALPQFGTGNISFPDGKVQSGNINICNLDQTIRFIDPSGDTLVLNDSHLAIKVTVGKDVFYRDRQNFIRLVDMAGDVFLGLKKTMVLINNEQIGAYGMASSTSSISSFSRDEFTGHCYKYVDFRPANWNYTALYMLYRNGRFYTATKKNFQKCFPDRKADIEAFFKENDVNPSDCDAVCRLFNLMK